MIETDREQLAEIKKILKKICDQNNYSDVVEVVRDMSYLLTYLEDGVYIVNGDGSTAMANDAFETISGMKREHFVGKNVKNLEKNGFWSESAAQKAIETKQKQTITQTYKNGKVGLVTSTPILNENGNVKKVVSDIRDITELKYLYGKLSQKEQTIEEYKNIIADMQKVEIDNLVFVSKAMEKTLGLIKRAAKVESNVLLLGESGSGKSVLAKLLGKLSNRSDRPFISVNCGAIPDQLFESELFGYEKGAFTGANKDGKLGLAEVADGGILFLDEISELSLNAQAKLLLFIDSKMVTRVGGTKAKAVDTRIIAAGNRDLKEMVKEGTFREDLYYRLSVIPITVPPLRERKEDIVYIVNRYIEEFNRANGTKRRLTPEVLECLKKYRWPGNIRELKNSIEQACALSAGEEIYPEDLPREVSSFLNDALIAENLNIIPESQEAQVLPIDLKQLLADIEKKYIVMALEKGKTVRGAAELLNIDSTALHRRKKVYGIEK